MYMLTHRRLRLRLSCCRGLHLCLNIHHLPLRTCVPASACHTALLSWTDFGASRFRSRFARSCSIVSTQLSHPLLQLCLSAVPAASSPLLPHPITGIRSSILVATYVGISPNGTCGTHVSAGAGFRTSLPTGAPAPVRDGCVHALMLTHIQTECLRALTGCAARS